MDAESGRDEEILSAEALGFVAALQREFRQQRRRLLGARVDRQRSLDSGEWPDFNPATRSVRAADWQVADVPKDLLDRRGGITGAPARPGAPRARWRTSRRPCSIAGSRSPAPPSAR